MKVGGGRERVRQWGRERVGDGGEKVGSGRGSGRGRERGGEWECVCKIDKVGDGRECESVRESTWWEREPVWDGRERESEIIGWERE